MTAITYDVPQMYQPTNVSCGHTAIAMLLTYSGETITPEDVLKDFPALTNEQGDETGSISQELATWAIKRGYTVQLYTFDFQIIDLSWSTLDDQAVLERLEAVKTVRNVPSLGKDLSRQYVQSYIDFLKAGGKLSIKPYPTAKLLNQLLEDGPVFVNVSAHVLYSQGRLGYPEVRKNVPDDLSGYITTHSVVLYGTDADGNFLLNDPWEGQQSVAPEALLSAITAAETECDSLCFTIAKKTA